MRRSVAVIIAIAGVLALSTVVLAKEAKPDATVKLQGKSVAAGVGFSWGKGTLTYKGKSYPFSVEGLSVGDVGVSSVTATGNVYHLQKLEDFDGQFTAVAAGATAGGGGGVAAMRNAAGVEMRVKATTRGVEVKAGVDGVKVKLEK